MAGSAAQLDIDRVELARHCQHWKINELAIFGSAARGELRPDSDIDLMVEFEPGAGWGLWGFVELKDEFERFFGRPVDLISKGTIRNPYRRRTIERDLAVIYGAWPLRPRPPLGHKGSGAGSGEVR